MGIELKIIDQDRLFESSAIAPILINDFKLTNTEDRKRLNDLIYTTYTKDSLEVIPSCDCGAVQGEYAVGITCHNCGTKCMSVTEKPLEPVLWIGTPEGIPCLVNPHAWLILKNSFMHSGVNILGYLTNPTYRVPSDKADFIINKIKNVTLADGTPIKRSLVFFLENFTELFETLINGKIIKFNSVKDRTVCYEFVQKNLDVMFPKHIPLPSKTTFIKETNETGNYSDTGITTPAIDAIRTISNLVNSVVPLTQKQVESKVVDTLDKLAEFYSNFYRKVLSPKHGWLRKHIYGSRVHFSGRAVITSITKPHHHKDLELPWSLSIMLLKTHLISKLLKLGFTPNDAFRHINENTLKYDPLLDQLFQELIAEAPGGKLRVILQRNPSLTRGSAQVLGVTKIKTNPKDNTIGLGVFILAAYNADFDGDALNLMLIIDDTGYQRMKRMEPENYALDLNKPRAISGFLSLQAPTVANLANWVHEKDGY